MADPWLKFFTSDWRSDPCLRMCSLAARGLWIEAICLMHEATPYGHLLVSGRVPTDAQLGVLAGAPAEQIPELLGELESAGVFSRTTKGVIYSRRLTRMQKKAAISRKNGKFGGNPNLRKQEENPPRDNLEDNPPDKTQKPEARSQKKEIASQSSAKKTPERFAEFWEIYPHRNGAKVGRKPSEAKYRAAVRAGASEQEIIDGAERYRSDRRVFDGFAKDPATWLNQAGWLDEVAPSIGRSAHQGQESESDKIQRWRRMAAGT